MVPQLLSNRSADFIWAAKALQDLGYKEVNLNLGCPSGTVVAKGKGSGFLRDLYALERFLDEIFSAGIDIPISIKTRLGWANTAEFGDLFFSLINAARLYKINPDNALERTNQKFTRRFNYLEEHTIKEGKSLKDMSLEEMDRIWNEAKAKGL